MKSSWIILFSVVMGLISCNSYKIANRHIDKKFDKANLVLDTLKTDDYTVEYWDNKVKDKPVLVMIHGFGAKTKYQWFRQLKIAKKNYRIVVPNLMYFGGTRPTHPKYGVQDQVEMLQHFLKELGIKEYTAIGASYGGLVAAETARLYPGQIKRLFLLDAAVKYVYESDSERVCKLYEVDTIPELFVPSRPAGMQKLVHASVGRKKWVPIMVLKDFHEEFYVVNREHKLRLVEQLIAIRADYEKHDYSDLTIPVHLIWGDRDQLIPADRAKKLKEHIGENTTLDIIRNGGHMPNLNKTNAFNRIFEKYLRVDIINRDSLQVE